MSFYKILLQHVFTFLKAQGDKDRILLLRKILLIDPSYYMDILEPKDGQDHPGVHDQPEGLPGQ
jgi:hypothetical protein